MVDWWWPLAAFNAPISGSTGDQPGEITQTSISIQHISSSSSNSFASTKGYMTWHLVFGAALTDPQVVKACDLTDTAGKHIYNENTQLDSELHIASSSKTNDASMVAWYRQTNSPFGNVTSDLKLFNIKDMKVSVLIWPYDCYILFINVCAHFNNLFLHQFDV